MTDNPQTSDTVPRTTREDWLALALDTLVRDGIDRLKIQIMARSLGVSRSSFYWHFKSTQDLRDQMLGHWLDHNTGPIIQRALRPADSIGAAVLNVFECWIDDQLFDPALDIAVRLWGRRDADVRKVVADADNQRLDALTRMFARYDYPPAEALVRARILYFSQIGQYTLDVHDTLDTRLSRTADFLLTHTGRPADPADIARFTELARART